jgi:alkylhydroperoxidase/carboxymuconolactone decarboxylase family protein YurZ
MRTSKIINQMGRMYKGLVLRNEVENRLRRLVNGNPEVAVEMFKQTWANLNPRDRELAEAAMKAAYAKKPVVMTGAYATQTI